MKLQYLKNQDLDQKIKSLAAKERELLTEILEVIKEIDARRMFLDFGFPNLFEYLTCGVGYSAGSAQRRIDAARLLREEPVLAEKIQSGVLNLSQISMVQKAARQVAKERHLKVSSEEKIMLLKNLENKNQREAEKAVASFFDLPIQNEFKTKTQKDDSVRIELTISKVLFEKIQQAQALLSHTVKGNDLIDYLEYVTDRVIQQRTQPSIQIKTQDFAIPSSGNDSKNVNSLHEHIDSQCSTATVAVKLLPAKQSGLESKLTPAKSGNFIPFSNRIKKQTLAQQKCCQYKDPRTGRQCRSLWFLQVDHKHAKWAGGDSSQENAQILCGAHNRRKYHQEVGRVR